MNKNIIDMGVIFIYENVEARRQQSNISISGQRLRKRIE